MVQSTDADIRASFQFATYVGSKEAVLAPKAVTVGTVQADYRKSGTDERWRFANMSRTVLFVV